MTYRRDMDAIHDRIKARVKASADRVESPAQNVRNGIQFMRLGRFEEAEARLWKAIEQLERESRT